MIKTIYNEEGFFLPQEKKPFKKDIAKSTFTISVEVKAKIEILAAMEKSNNTAIVEHLVNQAFQNMNPVKKEKELIREREKRAIEHAEEMAEKDREIANIRKVKPFWNKAKKEKQSKKYEAIKILKRKNKDGDDIQDILRVTQVWERITGVPSAQLLEEAGI